ALPHIHISDALAFWAPFTKISECANLEVKYCRYASRCSATLANAGSPSSQTSGIRATTDSKTDGLSEDLKAASTASSSEARHSNTWLLFCSKGRVALFSQSCQQW